MRIGFTGTQKGMTDYQLDKVTDLLLELKPDEVHHGDCVGADDDFHHMAKLYGSGVVIHPPVVSRKRAFCKGGVVLPAKDYLDRNHDIVDCCDLLIACPSGSTELLRSGTWATVRYARKVGKKVILVLPSGNLCESNEI